MDDSNSRPTVRLAHFSDLHIPMMRYSWQLWDWFNKRLTGWVNVTCLGRGKRFQAAEQITNVMLADLHERRPDHLICSGDVSLFGSEREFEYVQKLLNVHDPATLPAMIVPGNHDYYLFASQNGSFEKAFAPWQQGQRVEDQPYPFAQKVGHLWLLGVQSSQPTIWPWDATGFIDPAQIERLRVLLSQLDEGPRIVVTHYPLCLASGKVEGRAHRLHNAGELAKIAEDLGISLWLHGHRHDAYHLSETPLSSVPVICAGSATQRGRWSYGEYSITGKELKAVRRAYDPEQNQFRECETFELQLL